jgi:hypothetical protein
MTGQMDEPEQGKSLNSEPRETITLYRPVGAKELALIEASFMRTGLAVFCGAYLNHQPSLMKRPASC